MMGPTVRKVGLVAHVVLSVGWIGAVVSFLALSVIGLTSRDPELVRGVYLAMNVIGAFVIVPLSAAALLTGLVQSLGTQWGLFRYYWVSTKFALSVFATLALLLHQFTAVAAAAKRASAAAGADLPQMGRLGIQLVADATLGLVVLLVVATLSVFKPWGMTAYGRRAEMPERATVARETPEGDSLPVGLKVFLWVLVAFAAIFVLVHLAGGGLGHHH